MIGFVGSVFSPYYRAARKRGQGDPENHCAINVALYGKTRRWAMTERGREHVLRDAELFQVGRSCMQWRGDRLEISIDEHCAPIPFRVRGKIHLTPALLHDTPVLLSKSGGHYWRAVAPAARVQVTFDSPDLQWSGHAYHDMNWGDEPLESGFKNWSWLRTLSETASCVVYDVEQGDGSREPFALLFKNGISESFPVPALHNLPQGFWRMRRPVRSETMPDLVSTLEDAPFYTRNYLTLQINGTKTKAVHESLSLDRFVHPVTQWMLPFKMPRKA